MYIYIAMAAKCSIYACQLHINLNENFDYILCQFELSRTRIYGLFHRVIHHLYEQCTYIYCMHISSHEVQTHGIQIDSESTNQLKQTFKCVWNRNKLAFSL